MKTTLAGVLTILAGLAHFVANLLQGTAVDVGAVTILLAAVTAGVGLMKAQDAD